MIQRDKAIRDYNATDFVKYFMRKYSEINARDYPVVFARDCTIMLKIMRMFFDDKRSFKDIFTFMDVMFEEYPKRRRFKPIDITWLHGVTNLYLHPKRIKAEKSNKVKAPVELDDDIKKWLLEEKKKWLDNA